MYSWQVDSLEAVVSLAKQVNLELEGRPEAGPTILLLRLTSLTPRPLHMMKSLLDLPAMSSLQAPTLSLLLTLAAAAMVLAL